MLAGIFVVGGIDALRHPEGAAAKATDVGPAIAEPLGLPTDPVALVRINGAVQVAGGVLLATGKFPRLAAATLAASLVPTTYAGHRFWEEDDTNTKAQQRTHFLKNVAILGGLIVAAVDTEGRPSMTWRTRRALRRSKRMATAGAHLAHDVGQLAHGASGAVAAVTSERARVSKRRAAQAARATKGVAVTAAAMSAPRVAKARKAEKKVARRAHQSVDKTLTLADRGVRSLQDGGLDRAVEETKRLARQAKLPLAG